MVITKKLKGELERGLHRQSRWRCVIGWKMGDHYLKF